MSLHARTFSGRTARLRYRPSFQMAARSSGRATLWTPPRRPHSNPECLLHVDWRGRSNVSNAQILLKNSNFRGDHDSRRPLAVSMEISLGAQRSNQSFCVQASLSPCCGNHPWRQCFPRGSGIFAAPQFPTFSTISANSGHSSRAWQIGSITRGADFRPALRTGGKGDKAVFG